MSSGPKYLNDVDGLVNQAINTLLGDPALLPPVQFDPAVPVLEITPYSGDSPFGDVVLPAGCNPDDARFEELVTSATRGDSASRAAAQAVEQVLADQDRQTLTVTPGQVATLSSPQGYITATFTGTGSEITDVAKFIQSTLDLMQRFRREREDGDARFREAIRKSGWPASKWAAECGVSPDYFAHELERNPIPNWLWRRVAEVAERYRQ